MNFNPFLLNTNTHRTRAWRRKINVLNRGRDCKRTSNLWKLEKDWKNLWNRSSKQSRAKQLGIEYPRISSAKRLKQSKDDYWNNIN